MTALDWAQESEHDDVVEYLTIGINQTETAETEEVVLEEVPEIPVEVAEEEKKEEGHVHTEAEEVCQKNNLVTTIVHESHP